MLNRNIKVFLHMYVQNQTSSFYSGLLNPAKVNFIDFEKSTRTLFIHYTQNSLHIVLQGQFRKKPNLVKSSGKCCSTHNRLLRIGVHINCSDGSCSKKMKKSTTLVRYLDIIF